MKSRLPVIDDIGEVARIFQENNKPLPTSTQNFLVTLTTLALRMNNPKYFQTVKFIEKMKSWLVDINKSLLTELPDMTKELNISLRDNILEILEQHKKIDISIQVIQLVYDFELDKTNYPLPTVIPGFLSILKDFALKTNDVGAIQKVKMVEKLQQWIQEVDINLPNDSTNTIRKLRDSVSGILNQQQEFDNAVKTLQVPQTEVFDISKKGPYLHKVIIELMMRINMIVNAQ
jgi:hypothetical protein